MRELMVRDAIREALDEEMARDSTVFQMGEDIGVIGGNFKCTVGLRDKYGDMRVKDTPISEQGFEVQRMKKADIKRFLALYFEASMNGEQMPDIDGEQFYEVDDETSED